MTTLTNTANELSALAEKAEHHQAENKTTAPTLEHLADTHQTTRDTLSIVLIGEDSQGELNFVFHREPVTQPQGGADTNRVSHRIAVLGGGLQSREEEEFRRMHAESKSFRRWVDGQLLVTEEDLATPQYKNASVGDVPPNLWYRLQGKHMLDTGSLQNMEYDLGGEGAEAMLSRQLIKLLQSETSERASELVSGITVLGNAKPRITNVLNRQLGSYTDQIADKHGMKTNDAGELVGIGIRVREHFATATVADIPTFLTEAGGNAIAMTPKELIEQAKKETHSIDTWQNRMTGDGLPVRNSSLLVGAAAALKAYTPSVSARWNQLTTMLQKSRLGRWLGSNVSA